MKENQYNILYVDDEEINLRIFKSTFEDEYNVFTATSGEEGLEIIKSRRIDLIVTDQRMPGMTGVEFLKYAIDLNPDPNRILLTGFSDIDALSKAVNDGKIFQYINKPWDEMELKPIMNQAIESYIIKHENQRLTTQLKEKADMLEKEMLKKNQLLEQVRNSEKELKIAKEKAEESDRLKTAFLQNMSHEIRTPLNGIVGYSEVLKEMEFANEVTKKYASTIRTCSNQLISIVDDILDISRIQTDQLEISKQNIEIASWLNDLYDVFAQAVKDKGLEFVFRVPNCENAYMHSDKLRLTQIVNNLMSNAIKFTSQGFVELGCIKNNDHIVVYVKDTGIGIKPDLKHSIFERFSQGEIEITKTFGGNGLGLSIAKGLADLLDVKLWYDSECNSGSVFYVSIPMTDEVQKADPEVIQKSKPYLEPSQNEKKTAKILVAEDEIVNYEYILMLLRRRKYELLHANDGIEAIDLYRKNPEVDLILMDIKMPRCNGLEALKVIKKESPEKPIIAVTAFAMQNDRHQFLSAGFDAYLAKPIKRKQLYETIDLFL
jgi:signal transduction histidine kinase